MLCNIIKAGKCLCGLFNSDIILCIHLYLYVYLISFLPRLPAISPFTWGALWKRAYTHKHAS